jgi:hypothetical protein
MQRWQGAALAVVLCSGCLEPLVEDEPGYSRYVLPEGTPVPSAYDDLQINRKVDTNDGVTAPVIAPKPGFADGQPVQYWDFGASKRSAGAAYGLADCTTGEPVPLPGVPFIVDSIPGDADYTPFRWIQWACITPKYNREIVSSFDAMSDAVDLGLITDPTGTPGPYFVNCPVVTPTAELGFAARAVAPGVVYYKGKAARCHSFETQEGRFAYVAPPPGGSASFSVPTPNVYEVVKSGSTTVSRVVFAKGYDDPANPGTRNPAYSPNWLVITVELKATADKPPVVPPEGPEPSPEDLAKLCLTTPDATLPLLLKESDLVKVGMNNMLTPNNPCVAKVTATMNRVNRPFLVREEP